MAAIRSRPRKYDEVRLHARIPATARAHLPQFLHALLTSGCSNASFLSEDQLTIFERSDPSGDRWADIALRTPVDSQPCGPLGYAVIVATYAEVTFGSDVFICDERGHARPFAKPDRDRELREWMLMPAPQGEPT